jgi:hypothetical protein
VQVNAPGQWSNEGCGVESVNDRTWGKGFNEDGGGIIVLRWTDEGIDMWQFAKGTEPSDLSSEGNEIDPETWGTVSRPRICILSALLTRCNLVPAPACCFVPVSLLPDLEALSGSAPAHQHHLLRRVSDLESLGTQTLYAFG